jgi:hypothetical protein
MNKEMRYGIIREALQAAEFSIGCIISTVINAMIV